MNFDIPDISETAGKAVTGGKKRKTRKIGALRLGDSLRMIANHFTCSDLRRAAGGEESGADRGTHEGSGRSAGIKCDGYFRRYRDLDLCDTPSEG